MSTVIIPHLDLVINMIEKNIFRPLPILKKAGLPGEGVGMEEVINVIKSVITFSGPGLAALTTCIRILPSTDR
jgi:serine/threonine-protein phosphatase 2A regulatory subunit B'